MKRASVLGLAVFLLPASAFAEDEAKPAAPVAIETQPAASQPLPPLEEHPQPKAEPSRLPMERLRVNAGLKVGYVGTRGFDTYADSNTLPQFSIDATYMLWSSGRLGLAAGLGWDVGGRGDKLRGLDTSLTMHRFLVPLEARVRLTEWVWAFGKAAPGAALALGRIEDPSSPNALSSSGWAFAADVSAGATFAIGSRKHDRRSVRFLLTPEVGYSVTTGAPMSANPGREEDQLLGADADTNLRSVALSGFFWRTTVGVAW